MQTLAHGYRGLSFLVGLNWDRLLTTGTIILALYAGSYIALM
jgi:hypothetical protein